MSFKSKFPKEYKISESMFKKIRALGFSDSYWRNEIDPHFGKLVKDNRDNEIIKLRIAPRLKRDREYIEMPRYCITLRNEDSGKTIDIISCEYNHDILEYLVNIGNIINEKRISR